MPTECRKREGTRAPCCEQSSVRIKLHSHRPRIRLNSSLQCNADAWSDSNWTMRFIMASRTGSAGVDRQTSTRAAAAAAAAAATAAATAAAADRRARAACQESDRRLFHDSTFLHNERAPRCHASVLSSENPTGNANLHASRTSFTKFHERRHVFA